MSSLKRDFTTVDEKVKLFAHLCVIDPQLTLHPSVVQDLFVKKNGTSSTIMLAHSF